MTKKLSCLIAVAVLTAATTGGLVAGEKSKAEKRAEIDEMATEALERLFEESPNARALYDEGVGYAVFDNLKIAIGISGGGGAGVAVSKSGERTYMKMGTGGVGLGLGGQKYQIVFIFENDEKMTRFIDIGWQGDAAAQASAGTEGANAKTTFHDGMAIFQMTEAGLMASVDVSGTKYWKNKKLNQ